MKQIVNLFTPLNKTCPDCGKNCRNGRGCLITQIQNEVNKERGKLKPVGYVAVMMKLQGISDEDIAYCFSNSKDYKNRKGSFSKCFWGSLKIR